MKFSNKILHLTYTQYRQFAELTKRFGMVLKLAAFIEPNSKALIDDRMSKGY